MVKYKVGDKVELNCTEAEFCKNVGDGAQILAENFNAEGVATVSCVFSGSGVRLSEVVKGSGTAIVSDSNIWTIKPLKTSSKKHKENLCKKRGIKIKNQAAEINRLHEKIAELTSEQGGSEWRNGDECICSYFIGKKCVFIGYDLTTGLAIIEVYRGSSALLEYTQIGSLSKPETQEQKAAREREEMAIKLYAVYRENNKFKYTEWECASTYIKQPFFAMVDAGVTIK